ncbi:acid sphingomyelinase-like phosphodiesterase 3b [Plakobranchus ocellatus]|uniref:Acid sphingomyelinase-like phosphodiesterase 3b n=1 Tax=Plakobranchus ocellatus TaxID=259542 RepID=A0AAV4BZD6_9GAST|nr:acid sphingomyelinase-like phosphodiesterase 3b [Plakobranchus ocellatus]
MWNILYTLFLRILLFFGVILSGEAHADVGYFWHVSDFHYDDTYGKTGQSCSFPVSHPGPFGNGSCDSPMQLIEESLKSMASIKPDADFILWTGDNAAHIPTPEFSLKRNLYMINAVTSAIKRNFPNTLLIPSLGNHDFFPADYTNGTESELYDSVCQMWSAWIKDPEQINNCRRGNHHRPRLPDHSRHYECRSNSALLPYPGNHHRPRLPDHSRHYECRTNSALLPYPGIIIGHVSPIILAIMNVGLILPSFPTQVIIIGHVSPTIPAPFVLNWFYSQYQKRYVKLMTLFSDLIIAHHYGHEHKDSFKILQRDENGSEASPVFLAPSVTPLRGIQPKGEQGTRHNPGVRLVKYDRQTGKHLNYRQFYTNITEANHLGRAVWRELYSFQDAYNVPDMSVSSLRKILKDMAKPFSLSMLKYCSFYTVTPPLGEVCSIKQQGAFWCAAQLTNVQETEDCIFRYIHGFKANVRSWFCARERVVCKNSKSQNDRKS